MKSNEQQPQFSRGKYEKAAIYYMSGSGNTYRVANWMDEAAKENGINPCLASIESAKPEKEIEASDKQLVAMFLPTHGFTSPWHMIKFALKMPRKKDADAFCVATRGATKIGSGTIPGAAGTAALLIGLILFFKGYRLRGITGIDMPSNWMSLYTGFSTENSAEKIEQGRKKAKGIFNRLLKGNTNWLTLSNCWDLLVWGLPLLWLSALYLLVGRFFLAKLFFANNSCRGCGNCVSNCPTNAIKMTKRIKPRPYWKYNCESCMRCMGYCPEKAIEAGQSWLVVLMLIISIPFGMYFFTGLTMLIPGVKAIQSDFLTRALNFLFMYPTLFLSYYLFQWLIKFRLINILFTYTTFTHLYPRYHEPDTQLKEIAGKNLE